MQPLAYLALLRSTVFPVLGLRAAPPQTPTAVRQRPAAPAPATPQPAAERAQ